jgi:pSer/pThr/pTyr-binding forkhead associated (FHA) protein
MKSGPETGKIFKLDKDEFVIGRELINDLIISDPEISRKHARIFKKNNKLYLEDLNSTNGTFLSGKQINKPVQLKNGNLINLGKGIVLEFMIEEMEEIKPVVESTAKGEKEPEGTQELEVIKPTEKEKPVKKASVLKPAKKEKPPKAVKDESAKPTIKERMKTLPTWAVILLIVLLFLLVFCVLPFLIIEWTNQWCNLFGTFFNQIQPGVCP